MPETRVRVTWEEILNKLSNLKDEIIKESKRVLKKQVPKSEVIRDQVKNNLLTLYNTFIFTVSGCYNDLDDRKYNNYVKPLFNTIRDRLVRSFQVLQIDYKIPSSILKPIDPTVKDDLIDFTDDGDESDSIEKPDIKVDTNPFTFTSNMPLSTTEFFNFASKIIPCEFDGATDRLTSFLDALNLLKANVDSHEDNAVAYVKTRLTGRARDLIGDSNTLTDIHTKLKDGIKPESSQSVTTKILSLKQRHNDNKYATEIEKLTQSLKKAYLSEGVPEKVAESYTVNTTVRALSTNASSEKVKIIMEAASFQTAQDALTKFVNVSEDNSPSTSVFYANRWQHRGKPRNNFRGRRIFGYRGGNSYRNVEYRNNANRAYQNINNNYGQNRYAGTHQNRGSWQRGRSNRFVRAYDTYGVDSNQENHQDPQQGPLGQS